MRFFYSVCGLLALFLGVLSLWLNVFGGVQRTPCLCNAGFCEAEALARFERPAGASGQGGEPLSLILLRRDAASPFAWSDAAFAYQRAGDRRKARYCIDRAFQLGRGSAPLLMRILHFYMTDGSRDDVLRAGKAVLTLTHAYDYFVFRYYEAVDSPPGDVLDRGLPRQEDTAASYLGNLIGAGNADGAMRTWDWMRSHSLVTQSALNSYVRFLMDRGVVDASRRIWDEYHANERAPHNLIFNPNFEPPLSKGPYDWWTRDIAGATVEIDRTGPGGKGALRVEFNGADNLGFQHVGQTIPVPPGRLQLKTMVKCEGLTTNEGVAIHIYDRESPARFSFTTEQLTGTMALKRWEYRLTVPPRTRLLELRIERHESHKFDNKIKGTAWFSDVSLEPVQR